MPFKSKAQQRFMFATQPKTAEKWAKETPNMKKLPQKVKTEVKQPAVANTINFWVVEKANTPQEDPNSLYFKTDPIGFANQMRGGLTVGDIYGFYVDEDEAINAAHDQVTAIFEAAKALEEKKATVADKLQKTIDALQKKAEQHMKMVKKEPENADKHHEQAEKAMARIKELRGKHKMVEESKKEVKEMDHTKSGLKDPKKADLDKNKDISKYEQKRGKAIEKSIITKK